MTIPREEKWTLEITKDFLIKITHMKHPVKVIELRKEAIRCLRHFPMQHRIDKIFKKELNQWEKEVLK